MAPKKNKSRANEALFSYFDFLGKADKYKAKAEKEKVFLAGVDDKIDSLGSDIKQMSDGLDELDKLCDKPFPNLSPGSIVRLPARQWWQYESNKPPGASGALALGTEIHDRIERATADAIIIDEFFDPQSERRGERKPSKMLGVAKFVFYALLSSAVGSVGLWLIIEAISRGYFS